MGNRLGCWFFIGMRTQLIINICSGLLLTPYWAIHGFTPHSVPAAGASLKRRNAFEKRRQDVYNISNQTRGRHLRLWGLKKLNVNQLADFQTRRDYLAGVFGGKFIHDQRHHQNNSEFFFLFQCFSCLIKVSFRKHNLQGISYPNINVLQRTKRLLLSFLWLNIKLEEKFRGVLAEVSYNTHQWSSGEQAESHNVAADNSQYKRTPFGRGSVCL